MRTRTSPVARSAASAAPPCAHSLVPQPAARRRRHLDAPFKGVRPTAEAERVRLRLIKRSHLKHFVGVVVPLLGPVSARLLNFAHELKLRLIYLVMDLPHAVAPRDQELAHLDCVTLTAHLFEFCPRSAAQNLLPGLAILIGPGKPARHLQDFPVEAQNLLVGNGFVRTV